MKKKILKYDPLDPPKGDLKTGSIKLNTAKQRLTPPLREGWEGSL